MHWTIENPKDHWREQVHQTKRKGVLYSLEYIYKGDPEVGWWLFIDDEEEGEPISLILSKAKERVEARLR